MIFNFRYNLKAYPTILTLHNLDYYEGCFRQGFKYIKVLEANNFSLKYVFATLIDNTIILIRGYTKCPKTGT